MRFVLFSLSESCVHVSAILHALEDLFCREKLPMSTTSGCCSSLDPRPRKISPLPLSDLNIQKHVLDHSPARQFKKLENFNLFSPEARSQDFHQQRTANMVSDMENSRYISSTLLN